MFSVPFKRNALHPLNPPAGVPEGALEGAQAMVRVAEGGARVLAGSREAGGAAAAGQGPQGEGRGPFFWLGRGPFFWGGSWRDGRSWAGPSRFVYVRGAGD